MATVRLVAVRCAAVAAAVCGAASIAVACGSFTGDDGPVAGGEAGADAPSEGTPVGEAGTEASPPCDGTNLASDPNHCGKCGHSCLGGECVASACRPAVLAKINATTVYGPVLDATRAVVVSLNANGTSHVAWCAKAACATPLPAVDIQNYPAGPNAIASDETSAYVGTAGGVNGAVYRIGQDGTAVPIVPTGGAFTTPDDLAVFGPDLFFFSNYQAPPIGIYRVPVNGSSGPTQVVPVQASDRWVHMAMVSGALYANDFQSIARCAGPTCAMLETYAAPAVSHLDITGMVSDGTSLFWTSDQKLLLSCVAGATCAGPGTVVSAGKFDNGTPITLAIHGGDLYMTTDAGNIYTCTTAMCGQTFRRVIATGQIVERNAVADDAAVYWLETDSVVPVADAAAEAGPPAGPVDHRLMRLAK